ncbi:hypothetical protein P7K49_018149 [Saguinus oedipus]|uniref:Uncharacterized protein n=1 Tax=Saguinus oedipus TaxID=9490 RepID=A0ABQ9V4K1_SAGOE|nr:hypothetical protein P7K49_018149 [Saguinus oedipus]
MALTFPTSLVRLPTSPRPPPRSPAGGGAGGGGPPSLPSPSPPRIPAPTSAGHCCPASHTPPAGFEVATLSPLLAELRKPAAGDGRGLHLRGGHTGPCARARSLIPRRWREDSVVGLAAQKGSWKVISQRIPEPASARLCRFWAPVGVRRLGPWRSVSYLALPGNQNKTCTGMCVRLPQICGEPPAPRPLEAADPTLGDQRNPQGQTGWLPTASAREPGTLPRTPSRPTAGFSVPLNPPGKLHTPPPAQLPVTLADGDGGSASARKSKRFLRSWPRSPKPG